MVYEWLFELFPYKNIRYILVILVPLRFQLVFLLFACDIIESFPISHLFDYLKTKSSNDSMSLDCGEFPPVQNGFALRFIDPTVVKCTI